MLPLRIELEGFLSFREPTVLDFRSGWLWPITGKNAVGKSAVFDAITYALYGEHRGGSIHDEKLISQGADRTRVGFDFQVGTEAYRVERTIQRRQSRRRAASASPSFAKGYAAWRIEADAVDGGPGIPIPETSSQEGLQSWVRRTVGLGYETFRSSVLLQQGNADRFTLAKPAQRKDTLMELLDLTPYKRLEEGAKRRREEWDRKASDLENLLRPLAEVTREKVVVANQERRSLKKRSLAAISVVAAAEQTRESAEAFRSLAGQLQEADSRLRAAAGILAKARGIEWGHTQYTRLTVVLPVLERVVGHREQAARALNEAGTLHEQARDLGVDTYEEAEHRADEAAKAADQASRDARKLTAEARRAAEALRPKAEDGRELETLRTNREKTQEQLAKLQTAGRGYEAAVDRRKQCEVAGEALPHLRVLKEQRPIVTALESKLGGLREDIARLTAEAQALEGTARESREREGELREEIRQLELRQAGLHADLQRAKAELGARQSAQNEGTCSRCGQKVDAAHIQREISEAADRVGTLSEEMAKRTEALRQKTDQADRLAEGAGGDEAAAAKHREEAGQIQRTFQTESLRLERARSQLQVALRLLPEPYLDRASVESYPSDQVLLQTGQLAGNLEAARRECQRLEGILGQIQLLEQQVREALFQEESIVSQYPGEDLKALVLEYELLMGKVGELETAEGLAEQEAEKAQGAFRRAKAAADTARGIRQDLLERAANLEADAAAAQKVARALVVTVEVDWPEADAIDQPQLALLQGRCQRLSRAAGRKGDLDRAREDHAEYPREVKRLQGEIDRIPEKHRIPVAQAEAMVQEAQSELTALEKLEREATARARGLSQRFGQQARYQRELQKASAKRQDYSWLARAFGKSGLQSWLVKEALVAIGFAANDYLGNISEGCLRLDIKPNDDDLEILVTDFSSGQEALDVEFISGSQRFRTSVALALAIGQYSGGGSRSIRSVIIDEGFGSLDKDGRVEMIEQLKGLSGVLDKVILVSHQEEFHDAFPRGYHIVKENGTSRVLLRGEGELA